MKNFSICSLALLTFSALPCLSYADSNLNQEKLNQLARKIIQLEKKQVQSKQQQESTYNELRNIEQQIGLLSQKLTLTQNEIVHSEETLKKLDDKNAVLKKIQANQTSLLEKHLITAYQMGKHPMLKLVLNQQSPNALNRLTSYYSYINKARFDLIRALQINRLELQKTRDQQFTTLERLNQLKSTHLAEQKQLKQQQREQGDLIESLRRKIQSRDSILKHTRHNKRHLEQLISNLQKQHLMVPEKPFAKMRYKLPWPVKGLLEDLYGKSISGSKLKHNGVKILAPENTQVTAVYPGKVVFSDWLRGFGLIVILDHGLGYMTLYANNQSLLKEPGQHVEMGETIASVGHSGGEKENGVYFEIRKNGKAIDPLRWLKANG